jgi:hypothetical protein
MTPMSLFLNLAPSQTVNLVKITLIQYPIFRIIDRYHTYKITIKNLSTDISSGICRYLHIYKFTVLISVIPIVCNSAEFKNKLMGVIVYF